MFMLLSRKSLLILLLVPGILFAGCSQKAVSPTTSPPQATSSSAAPSPVQFGGTLKVLSTFMPPSLGYPPDLAGFTASSDPALEKLVYDDPNGKIVPGLATEWKVAPDLKSITFTLRKGVKFHDGTGFDAEAVKFNLEARKAAKKGDLENVSSIDAIDPYTVRLNLSTYSNTILNNLASYSGYIASPAAIRANGKEWALFNPVGTGPFQFVSYDKNVSLKYKKFPGYWDNPKPYLDNLEIAYFADPQTAQLALQGNNGHVLYPTNAREVATLKAAGIKVVSMPPGGVGATAFFPDSKDAGSPFSNVKVRMAAEYAIDKAKITSAFGFGYMEAQDQLALSSSAAFNPGLERKYDPVRARQLLNEAGYPKGFKTFLIDTSGAKDYLTSIRGYLRDIGIEAEIDMVTAGKKAEMVASTWDGLMNGQITPVRHPAATLQRSLPYSGTTWNAVYRPPEWQSLMDRAVTTPDYDTMISSTRELVKAAYDQAMITPVYTLHRIVAFQDSVNGMDFTGFLGIDWSFRNVWLRK